MTGWAVLGLEAAGRSPFAVRNGGATPIDYLRRDGGRPELGRRPRADDPGARRRRRQPAAFRRPRPASGASPPHLQQRFGAGTGQPHRVRDPCAALRGGRAVLGSGSPLTGCTARRTGTEAGAFSRAPPATRTARARRSRAWPPPARPATRCTGASRSCAAHRIATGAFPWRGTTVSNSQSTAWAIQGLVAAGVSPAAVREHGHSPFDYLSRRQRATATTATRPRATRPRSGSRARRSSPSGARPSRLRPVARPVRHRRSSGHAGGGSSGSDASSAAPTTSPIPRHVNHGPAAPPATGSSTRRMARAGEGARSPPGRSGRGEQRTDRRRGAACEWTAGQRPGGPAAAAPPPRRRLPHGRLRRGWARGPGACPGGRLPLVPPAPPLTGPAVHWIPCRRWRSPKRFAPGGRTRRSSPSPWTGRCSTSCSSSPGGRPTTTSPTPGASGLSGRGRSSA